MKSCTLFLAGLLLATAAHAQNGVARVNGVAIPQQRMDLFMKDLTAQGRPDTPELRNAVRQELIDRELLSQEATRRGFAKKAEIAAQLDLARQSVLVRALLNETLHSGTVGEDAIKKEYERIKGSLGSREYKARHILVDKEDEAKDIISQIKGGGSFEKLATDRSKDQGSKVRGGELDWSAPTAYVKPFGEALTRLKKGQMTETPVQSQFGWHVIRLDDERALKVPAYDQVKDTLQKQVQQQQQKLAYEKIISELRAKAKIE